MPISFACPNCRAESTVPDAAAGKVITCVVCGAAVQLPASAAELEAVDAEPVTLRPAVVVALETPADAPRSRAKKRAKPRGTPGWVWAVVAASLLMGAGGAAYYFLVLRGDHPPAAAGGTADKPGGGPAAPAAKWAPFTLDKSSVTLDLPGVPTIGVKRQLPVSAGKLEMTPYTLTATVDGKPLTFELATFAHPSLPAWAVGNRSVAEFVADKDARPGSPEPVKVDGRDGVRYVRQRDGAGEVLVYFGTDRATYKVAVAGDGVGPDHPAVKRALDSIRTR